MGRLRSFKDSERRLRIESDRSEISDSFNPIGQKRPKSTCEAFSFLCSFFWRLALRLNAQTTLSSAFSQRHENKRTLTYF